MSEVATWLADLGIETKHINLLQDPIGKGDYDLITAWELIEHIPFARFGAFLDNVHAALVPGGHFVFSTPDYDSAVCRMFDFWNVAVPFHHLVFSKTWLCNYFGSDPRWHISDLRWTADLLDDIEGWCAYASKAGSGIAARAAADVMAALFAKGDKAALTQKLLDQELGSEIIVTLRKLTAPAAP